MHTCISQRSGSALKCHGSPTLMTLFFIYFCCTSTKKKKKSPPPKKKIFVVCQGRGGSNPGRVPGGRAGDPVARAYLLSPPSSTASCLEHCRTLAHQDRSLRVKVNLLIFIFFFLYRLSQKTVLRTEPEQIAFPQRILTILSKT